MRILIAEDDPIMRRLLEVKLRKWGHEVILVSDGLEAWRVLQREDAPQLAILDWMMPGMEGVQLCREVRKRGDCPYTYVLLLTAKGQKEDIVEGIHAGADDYLTKPFDTHELRARLRAGERILDLQARLIAVMETLRERAARDSLTGCWNHSAILELLQTELARAHREGTSTGVILADLDHFKQINDTHGHMVGDEVLREVAQRIRMALRPYDQIGRYGGEEFLIVLPRCEALTTMTVAERLRASVASTALALGSSAPSLTLSLGLAVSARLAVVGSLVRAADRALYRAKDGGRNRWEWADPADLMDEPAEAQGLASP